MTLKNDFAKAKEIVDQETVQMILKDEKVLIKDPFDAVISKSKKRPMTIGEIFVYFYYIMEKSDHFSLIPEKLLSSIKKMIRKELSRARTVYFPFGLRGRLWEDNSMAFFYISFIFALGEVYKKKTKAARVAMKIIDSLDEVLTKYYKTIIAI